MSYRRAREPGGQEARLRLRPRSRYIVSPSIRDAFDIIGVDPRGVAVATPSVLSDAEIDYYFASDGTPDTHGGGGNRRRHDDLA